MKRLSVFAEFYHLRSGAYVNAVGDRSVLILDGRKMRSQHHWWAKRWAVQHSFDGYRLCRGTLTDPFYLTAAVQEVPK